jgi:CheY-like chemotaxis protein
MSQGRAGSRSLKVLLVDDTPANLVALEAILEGLDMQLFKASSGEQALRLLLTQGDFSLILMDVRMAGLNGYEVAALIRGRERTRHIPILFLTAYDQDEAERNAGSVRGMAEHLRKPFTGQELRARVEKLLGHSLSYR